MPQWIKQLIEKFKAANPTATPEQLQQLERDALALAPPEPTPPPPTPPKPGDPPAPVVPPEINAQLKTLTDAVATLTQELGKVVTHVNSTEQSAALAAAAAAQKRYTDHVEKLFNEGRMTKAEKDAFLVKEKMDEKIKVLDSFIEDSGRWAVNPALVKKGTTAPAKPGDTPPAAPVSTQPGAVDMAALRQQALEEVKTNMAS